MLLAKKDSFSRFFKRADKLNNETVIQMIDLNEKRNVFKKVMEIDKALLNHPYFK